MRWQDASITAGAKRVCGQSDPVRGFNFPERDFPIKPKDLDFPIKPKDLEGAGGHFPVESTRLPAEGHATPWPESGEAQEACRDVAQITSVEDRLADP